MTKQEIKDELDMLDVVYPDDANKKFLEDLHADSIMYKPEETYMDLEEEEPVKEEVSEIVNMENTLQKGFNIVKPFWHGSSRYEGFINQKTYDALKSLGFDIDSFIQK